MKLSGLFGPGRGRRDAELDEEVRTHLQMAAADLVGKGDAPAAAAAARREFGNVAQVKEITREMWGGIWFERLLQDVRFGVRMLRRSPGFAFLAILCLTLGIGANAAVYSWIEGILLRPYPLVVDQDRLFEVGATVRGRARPDAMSWPDLLDLRRNATLIDAFVTDKITGTTLSIGNRAERVPGQIVSANYFDAIGVRPIKGRGFEPAEELGRNAHPVVVISYRLWRDRFQLDPQVLGKTERLNGVPHTIIGVTPEAFNGTFVGYKMQFWVPVSMQETFDLGGYKLEDRGAHWIESFVRVKPGVSRAQAQYELAAIAKQLETTYPETNRGRGVELYPLWKAPFNNAGALFPTLRIALVVAAFVLLIACANVSNLLLVRSFARRHEMVVRLAVGSGRSRLVRQLLTEGLILSGLAAVAGLLVAHWCRNLIVLVVPSRGIAMNLPASIDWRVLAGSAAVCLVTTLLFGLVPALLTSQIDLASGIKSETGRVVSGGGRSRIRSGLVVLQVSLSFVLLVGAGLLIRSLARMRSASPGFAIEGTLLSGLDLTAAEYTEPRERSFEDELMDRVHAIPGVQSAAYVRVPPFSLVSYSAAPLVIEGYAPAPDELPAAPYDQVSPDYFATLGIPLVAGRDFTRADDATAPPVAIVNETMATKYWPGINPLGRVFELKGRRVEVVGVAKTAKYQTLLEPAQPFFYVPLRQDFARVLGLVIRTAQGPGVVAAALRQAMHALDPGVAPESVYPMRMQIDQQAAPQTLALSLVSAFGAVALLLAAVGLYGVLAYVVSQSTRELGMRMALGARAQDIWGLVMKYGVLLTGIGVALGATAALGTTRLLGDLLYQVSPRDPLAFVSAGAVLAVASLAACAFPAWRATRTNPAVALRV